jgi:hypothetical protein
METLQNFSGDILSQKILLGISPIRIWSVVDSEIDMQTLKSI